MFGNARDFLSGETRKPQATGRTLARLGQRFVRWWPMLLFAVVCIVVSTWAQVTTPALTGQLVDCYLVPTAGSSFGNFPGFSSLAGNSTNTCWFAQSAIPHGFTQTLLTKAFSLGGFVGPKADGSNMDTNGRVAGLLRMVLILIVLFALGSGLIGLTFFSMAWAGQHVLRTPSAVTHG